MSAQQAAVRRANDGGPDVAALMAGIGRAARAASRRLARASAGAKNEALTVAATTLRARVADLVAANEADVAAAQANGVEKAFLDRLRLDPNAIEGIARGLDAIVALPDPVGRLLAHYERPNGLLIDRVATPLGVIGVIYESRPGVTADAGALCLKAGNAVILRGGTDSFRSAGVIHECLLAGLAAAGLPAAAIQRVPVTDRAAVGAMLAGLDGHLDVIVPRGGKSLVARVQAEARVPVFAHLEGINHIYVHAAAELPMAKAILKNSKLRSTSVCGAAETLLIDRACAATHLAPLVGLLLDSGCTVRGDAATLAVDPRVEPATADDWGREFLDAVMAVKVVDGLEAAVAHIEHHGSQHTDCIVTADQAAADRFLSEVDSAIVLHNASTQFADGGEFGFGGEIGIATGRLHARGPVGLEQLTTFNYRVRGSGQIRS
jgi:glutamate-5-semialdehyde dehydrogenase